MRFPKNAKIEAMCSNDETRCNLQAAYLDLTNSEDPRLVATDGHVLVAVKVEPGEHDATGFVTQDAIKAARKALPKYSTQAELMLNGTQQIPQGATFPRPDLGQFPAWRQILPGEREEQSIAFDVSLLKRIVDAAGGSGEVRIRFAVEDGKVKPAEPLSVDVLGALSAIAVLMPVRW